MNGDAVGAFVGGLGLGATLMFLVDPARGRRRRAIARNKLAHARHEAEAAVAAVKSDARWRTRGAVAELRGRLHEDEPVDEDVLLARVHARMGRLVSHPRAIEVEAHDGTVTLRGDVFGHEAPALIRGLRAVRGVHRIESHLRTHEADDGVAALRTPGHPLHASSRSHRRWPPMWRAIGGILGGALALYGRRRGGGIGVGLGTLGAATLVRSALNRSIGELVG